MAISGNHRINNFDWYSSFGCYFDKEGIDQFYNFSEIKEPFSHDWQDGNGKDYDLSAVYFQDAQITIGGTMVAKTVADLKSKRSTLKAILIAPGEKTWWLGELNQNFQFFYRKMIFTRRTAVNDRVGKIGMAFQLTIQLLSINTDNVPAYPNSFMLTKTVSSYAAMTALGVPVIATQYKVATDEITGLTNALYQYWPDGALILLSRVDVYKTYATFSAIVFPLTRKGIIEVVSDETRLNDDGTGKHVYYFVPNGGAATSASLKYIASTQQN